MKKLVKVSIVIPAYNEQSYIENCLFSLLRSEQKTNIDYEVILVDNNSTDKTVEVAKKFKKGMNLKIVSEKKQGRGAARARGFEKAQGEIILSADADTSFYKGWIETLTSDIKDEVVATATSANIKDCSFLTNLSYNFMQSQAAYLYRIIFGYSWLVGFSFAILRSAYEKSGGFNPHLQAQEDIDLSLRVAKVGRIKFIDKPVIISGRRFKEGLLMGIYEYIKTFSAAVFLKRKNVYLDNPR